MANQPVERGSLLISEPFLSDPNFARTVVLVCEHTPEGTFGLVLNQPTSLQVKDVLDDVYVEVPVFVGGPVQQNTLHIVHRRPDLIAGAATLADGLHWGGDLDEVTPLLNLGTLPPEDVRFFLGYSGWGAGQLARELAEDSWIVTRADPALLFATSPDALWRAVLRAMGGKHQALANYPTDPRLN